MTFQFSKRLWLITITIFLLFSVSTVGIYYFYFIPMTKKIMQVTKSIEIEEKLSASYEKRGQGSQTAIIQDSSELQKKVPVKPVLEQFLLDLEQAEVVSNSFISSMSFGNADMPIQNQDQAAQNTNGTTVAEQQDQQQSESGQQGPFSGAGQADEAAQIQNGATSASEQTKQDVTTPPPAELPAGMKRLTVNMTVQSPDFYAMIKFLQTIEDLERITKIDSIAFVGKQEVTTLDQETSKALTFTITLSTFYHPGLQELEDELPPFETPEPGHKQNPLAQAGSIEENNSAPENSQAQTMPPTDSESVQGGNKTANEQTLAETESKKGEDTSKDVPDYEVIKHRVEEGETLYSISMQYFKARKGEEIIQKWNNLPDNTVFIGQILSIPVEKK